MSERRSLYTVQSPTVQERTRVIDGKTVDFPAQCPDCGKKLMGYAARPWQGMCRHCRKEVRRH